MADTGALTRRTRLFFVCLKNRMPNVKAFAEMLYVLLFFSLFQLFKVTAVKLETVGFRANVLIRVLS